MIISATETRIGMHEKKLHYAVKYSLAAICIGEPFNKVYSDAWNDLGVKISNITNVCASKVQFELLEPSLKELS
jgi:hypothetical protein